MKEIKHTLESCKESASKYNTRSEWRKNDNSCCQTARNNGWYDECCANMNYMRKKHTLQSCKENASKYKTKSEWKKNNASVYQTAYKNGWLDKCCVNMLDLRREKKIILTLDDCKKIASKYKSKSEWRKSDYKSLYFAYRNGWLEECCVTMIDYKTKAKHIAIEDILKDDFYKKNYINLSHIIKEFKNFPLGYYTLDLEIY